MSSQNQHHHRTSQNDKSSTKIIPSKDMDPFPDNFFPIFFRNQFRTKIELPSKSRYPDVEGLCGIITGSNTGLGHEASSQLLSLGLSRLIMGVRSIARGEAAASKLRSVNPSARIDVWDLDMESYDSIQAFARRVATETDLPRIDFVILNAGVAPVTYTTTKATGHEQTIQVNHIGTFLLSTLLLPTLRKKKTVRDDSRGPGSGIPATLTIVNSVTAHLAKFPNKDSRPLLPSFDDPKTYDPQERYGVSKLLNQLATVRLCGMVDPDDVIINMVDPGLTKNTNLARDAKGALALAVKVFNGVAGRPLDRAASTYVSAVLGYGKESHGCFMMNGKIAPLSRWYYSPEGKTLTDVIWKETAKELESVVNLEDIVASLKHQS
ncbi:hypothetical protein H2204_012342 [Knufia peltigerae]|uniref:Short-chain dehydrogenase/reductase family protein n=1 Tax=Knufia peltigerae TaxID=1002370 RepID=A0AA38XSV1_9EURO|nr:hypothetical protein H2204_012342 [Knufia peltigerae]